MFCVFFIFQSCGRKSAADFNSDFSLFKEYIVSFTGGIVSSESDIRVVLAFDKKEWKANQVLDSDLFDISPSVDGKVVALSTNTIAFIPEKKLKPGTEYQVTLNLDKLITIPKEKEKILSEFNFTVKTIKQDFTINTADIQSYSKEYQYLNCVLKTANNIDIETAKKLVEAKQKGNNLKIKFEKKSGSGKEFNFIIDSIQRYSEATNLEILYDGSSFDIDQKGQIDVPITNVNEFKIVKVEVPDGSNQSVLINFSEPLEKGQDFKGLVSIQNANNLKFSTQGNLLKVYFSNEKTPVKKEVPVAVEETSVSLADSTTVVVDSAAAVVNDAVEVVQNEETEPEQILAGDLLVEVFQGIESQYGKKMDSNYNEKITFDQIKPSVRFIKNGTILPSSNNLKLNFEAVNLSAVDVKVYKIYKNNILQFLQYNELNGSQNLKKVAQPVAKTTLKLNENKLVNPSKWNTYALDLSKIITPEPGAIYRVEFVYKKKYSLYKCETSDGDQNDDEEEEVDENDVNYSGNSYDDYYYDDYEWRESQDPCSGSYYYNARIATNILATDLGVIAKRGENKSYLFAVNNIVTTEPISNARVELYTYQQQKIATAATNSEGIASFQLDKFAYFAIVSLGNQSTYVKLDDGLSLSVSNFDVAGETLQKGLKGFIYGERGVWRPGDNLYLSFILNDASNKLPKSHPIKFRLNDPNGKTVYQTIQKQTN